MDFAWPFQNQHASVPAMCRLTLQGLLLVIGCLLFTQCADRGVLMGGPTLEARNAAIACEPVGDFYYGRRYYVEKTRFWGYLRQPRQPWNSAKLVMMLEDQKLVPDRLPEDGPEGKRFGYDQNHEYRIWGHYTGRRVLDPNSNQILPEFRLTGYELLDRNPGWLFDPEDRYRSKWVSLKPR